MADEPEVIDLLFKPFFDRLGFTECAAVFPFIREPDQMLVKYTHSLRGEGFRLAMYCNGNLVWDQDFEFEAEGGMSLRDAAWARDRAEALVVYAKHWKETHATEGLDSIE